MHFYWARFDRYLKHTYYEIIEKEKERSKKHKKKKSLLAQHTIDQGRLRHL